MKIGIDCRTILSGRERAGVGYYTYHLVKGLVSAGSDHQFVLFFNKEDKEIAKQFKSQNVEICILPSIKILFFSSHLFTAIRFYYHKLDLLHAPANVLPLFYFGKSVLTIHDLAIYKYPEFFPEGQSFSKKFVVPQSIKKANRIIAISESTKRDLSELFKVSAEKIEVVYPGVDLEKFKPVEDKGAVFQEVSQKFRIKKPYILFLGTLEPRKNLVRLIQAYKTTYQQTQECKYVLVIAGGKGWKYGEIFKEAEGASGIVFTDYVSDEDKVKLLQSADVFVFPSIYEGFGLPVLEALACSTPVVCSNTSSLPEVGGEAVTYINPESVEDIARGILSKRPADRTQAEKFSWQKTVEQTLEVYRI